MTVPTAKRIYSASAGRAVSGHLKSSTASDPTAPEHGWSRYPTIRVSLIRGLFKRYGALRITPEFRRPPSDPFAAEDGEFEWEVGEAHPATELVASRQAFSFWSSFDSRPHAHRVLFVDSCWPEFLVYVDDGKSRVRIGPIETPREFAIMREWKSGADAGVTRSALKAIRKELRALVPRRARGDLEDCDE